MGWGTERCVIKFAEIYITSMQSFNVRLYKNWMKSIWYLHISNIKCCRYYKCKRGRKEIHNCHDA